MFLNCAIQREVGIAGGNSVHELEAMLVYDDGLFRVEMPVGFQHDGSSVPRLPAMFLFFGGKGLRSGALHDYCYRKDAKFFDYKNWEWVTPSYSQANMLYRRALKTSAYGAFTYFGMWFGVAVGGWPHFHKRAVLDRIQLDVSYEVNF